MTKLNELFFIDPDSPIKEAMRRLDKTQGKGLIVVDESKRLLGTLTDGDIRRALLAGIDIKAPVEFAMHKTPLVSYSKDIASDLYAEAKKSLLKLIPILDSDKRVVEILFMDGHASVIDIPVVIMAGGLGSRLGDLTKNCPKPMLRVGGRPLLEIIIERLTSQGFSNFYIAVNYKADVIERYFEDGQKFGCTIHYLREKIKLGTAGALSLLPKNILGPIIVMNGDLLTQVDFRNLKDFHYRHDSPLTVSVRKYDLQIPYGVINIDDTKGMILSLDEKPVQSFFVNAGVYVINSSLLKHIPENEFFDMPTFINNQMKQNVNVICFPIAEKWIDIGHIDDLNYAREKHDETT